MANVGLVAGALVRPVAKPVVESVARIRSRPSPLSLVVLVVALVLTAASALIAGITNDHNEDRLLRLQTRQGGALLQALLPSVETPLASAAAIAASSGGAAENFRRYATGYVGLVRPFASMSLWQVSPAGTRMLTVVGDAPHLSPGTTTATAFLTPTARAGQLGVIGMLTSAHPRLGYAYASSSRPNRYVVYAESALPADRRAVIGKDSPFHDLLFALYLGRTTATSSLVETNADQLPVAGRTATITVPFGSATLTLKAASVGELGGRFSSLGSWIIGVLGSLLALTAALMADRLVKRRRAAEVLTDEVEVLLQDQRTIAQTLQRALRPSELPSVAGLELAARYLPGVNGIEIGGDWYDVIPVDDDHFFFVVGDVSGRGLDAGSIMASLHFAIRGFVAEGHAPATVLNLLGRLVDVHRDKHFATVLCGYADAASHEITVANAGHLPPLVVDADGSTFLTAEVGPPIGVSNGPTYEPVTISMAPHSTLLAYTDGLVERRGESLDDGLRRLQGAAVATSSLEQMLSTIVAELTPHGSDDDTALLGLRWT